MRRNRIQELLRAGQPSAGTHVHSAWPAVVVLAGHSGLFDYVVSILFDWFKSESRALRDALGGG